MRRNVGLCREDLLLTPFCPEASGNRISVDIPFGQCERREGFLHFIDCRTVFFDNF